MNYELAFANASQTSPRIHPYSSTLSSSASSSSSSVFSVDAISSQSSESSQASSGSNVTWESEWRTTIRDDDAPRTVRRLLPPPKVEEPRVQDPPVAADLRQNSRRSSISSNRAPPPLIRQSERKGQFVDCLVESATQMVEVIWPLSVPSCRGPSGHGVLPLRTFIQETLRRSRTSFSTLQVALYYLILIKAHVPKYDFTMEQPMDTPWCRALQCGRRMFLAALILASKYLQDRNYSARAWSKISGLTVCEINTNEMAFLQAVDWKLHVPEPMFERWQEILIRYTNQQPPSPGSSPLVGTWKSIVPRLTPGLDMSDNDQFSKPIFFRNFHAPKLRRNTPVSFAITDISSSPEMVSSPISAGPPRVLEPTPTMQPPTPSLVRMGPLPTPNLTPQSAVSNTPAASYAGTGSRRLSFCSAMARVQRDAMQRSVYDCRWPNASIVPPDVSELPSRRPSVLSDSSLSSPESMISDTSSRCSRTSSVSSASSGCALPLAPTPVKLARLATLRSAGQTYSLPMQPQLQVPSKETGGFGSVRIEPLSAEPMSSPDFESFHISDSETPHASFQGKDTSTSRLKDDENMAFGNSRKRGRSSVDLSLQQNVRSILNPCSYTDCVVESPKAVIPDEFVPRSFLFNEKTNEQTPGARLTGNLLRFPSGADHERRHPVQKCCGRKRACCAPASIDSFSPFPRRVEIWR